MAGSASSVEPHHPLQFTAADQGRVLHVDDLQFVPVQFTDAGGTAVPFRHAHGRQAPMHTYRCWGRNYPLLFAPDGVASTQPTVSVVSWTQAGTCAHRPRKTSHERFTRRRDALPAAVKAMRRTIPAPATETSLGTGHRDRQGCANPRPGLATRRKPRRCSFTVFRSNATCPSMRSPTGKQRSSPC